MTRGVMWTGVTQITVVGTRIVVIAVLARLLSPEDFGVIAAVSIFTGFILLVNDLGLSAALIQREDLDDNHLSTTFWAGIAAGIGFWTLAIIASPLVANFFNDDLVRKVLMFASTAFLIGPLGAVQRALFTRNLDFKKLAISEIVGMLVYGTVSITLAVANFGVWSLVWGVLAMTATTSAIVWVFSEWHPKFKFSPHSFRQLFRFGKFVAMTRIVGFTRANIDYLLVGRLLGQFDLGIYSIAYGLITLPAARLSSVVSRVSFPAFSRIQHNDERLRRGYLRATSYTSVVTFPMLAGLSVVTPELVAVVFGDGWSQAIWPIRALCIVGIVTSVGTLVGTVFKSKDRPDLELKSNIVYLVTLTAALLVGIQYGIVGVAVTVALVASVEFPIIQWIAGRLIALTLLDYFRCLYPATISSALMAACVLGFRELGLSFLHLNSHTLLASGIIVGGVVYVVTMLLVKPTIILELKNLVSQMLKPHDV